MAGTFTKAGGEAGGAIGSAIGYYLTGDNRDKAQKDYEGATQAYRDLLQHDAAAYNAAGNAQDRGMQLEALARLKDAYANQGLDAGTRAQLQAIQQSNAQQAQAQNAAVQNQMAQRGMADSGASFAMQQANNQAAQNQANSQAMQAAALGQQNKMAALGAYGQMAQGLNGQDNALSQFNAANMTSNARANADRAQAHDEFRAQGIAGGLQGQATNQMDQAAQEQGAASGIGKGIGTIAGAFGDFFTGGGMM